MSFDSRVRERLQALRAEGLHRRARRVDGPQGPRFVLDGREVLCLCSNNYLGLAGDPAIGDLAAVAVGESGLGAGASRLISGSMAAHLDAEAALADWMGAPESVLFSSGYAANVGVMQALLERDSVVFSDALNHASLIDGARLSRAPIVVYRHADMDDLRAKLRTERAKGAGAIIASESLFSMDGDIAPLSELRALADEYDAGLVIDDAHAVGVYGPSGAGLCAARGVRADALVGTLGKAVGAQGAFVAANADVCDLIRNRARSYVFSTAPAAPMAALVRPAVSLVRAADDRRARLLDLSRRLRDGLLARGYEVLPGESPIIPVLVGDPEPTMALSQALLERGVFAHGIRPPTVPVGQGRLRVVPMASHSDADIAFALDTFAGLSN